MKSCRVLVIEDELLVGLDLVWTLEHAGFTHVEHAATEGEALDSLERSPWDAVVADANLNGCGVGRIVTILHNKRVPFLIVTGYERQNLPAVIGDAPVIGKPFSHRQLLRTVQDLCSQKPPEAPAQPDSLSTPS